MSEVGATFRGQQLVCERGGRIVFARLGAPLTENFPGSQTRSSSAASSRCAAIFRALSRIFRAATAAAAPATGVERLAYVPSPYGAVSVSPSSTWMWAAGIPNSSARI